MGRSEILDLFEGLEQNLTCKLLSPESRIILMLAVSDAASSQDLMNASRCSPAGFHIVRRRMMQSGILQSRPCPEDSRSKLYSLTPSARDTLRSSLPASL